MGNGIRTCIASTVFALLLVAPSCWQDEPTADPLAYTPTGDALWDTYAQALLEQLPSIRADFGLESTEAAILPDKLLASWEADFGDDQRYWQLRFWNKVSLDNKATFQTWEPYDMFDFLEAEEFINPAFGTLRKISPPDSVSFLIRGKELGATDWASEFYLFQFLKWRLEYIEENLEPGNQIEDEYFDIPEFENETAIAKWFAERKLALSNELVAGFPDDSWAWYHRARLQFDADNWESGLADLRQGNQAKFNRNPICFPMSYIAENTGEKPHAGNRIAAGIVAESYMFLFKTMGARLTINKEFDNQIQRIQTGSSMKELEPWHPAACRLGSMENSGAGDRLCGIIPAKILLRYFLTETPESVTEEQRVALDRLDIEVEKTMDTIGIVSQKVISDSEAMVEEIRTTLVEHGVSKDPWDIIGSKIDNIKENKALNIALHEIHLLEQYANFEAKYVTISQKIDHQFDELATFDFEALSWPETN